MYTGSYQDAAPLVMHTRLGESHGASRRTAGVLAVRYLRGIALRDDTA